ncbi:lytic transglycosylase domain-containing protein [Bosea caraganae]|uniref:lytic transglycosylase domain-containing protein n=1 Tax=Bosea caraganae TaxID=2763117 RepID=UPI0015F02224|nr:transglycosylase SLT domain-containing protein [Bosea caraganae]
MGKSHRRQALAAPAGSDAVRAIIARYAANEGVPFALADAVVRVESRYNPRAAHAGNFGLMQIRHQTARGLGYSGSPSGLLDAETNARFGMKYLAQAYRLAGGDTCRAIMKYQSGHLATRMSGANRTYCAKVRTISAQNS